jgi:hypothetical protein
MSKIEVNAVEPQCGTTLTLGASGDTVTIPSGATISNLGTAAGFGSTGEVSWNTTVKTADFTATSGSGFFVNTASGAVTVTLPASPSAGNVVAVSDYNSTAATNTITIGRNGSNINGAASNLTISKANSAVQLVYVDATTGWQSVTTANTTDVENPFIAATGGTVTCCGDFKIHTFTGPGTFTVTNSGSPSGSTTVDYLVIAGGGSGGSYGGGGAGGYRFSDGTASGCYSAGPSPLSASALPVTAQGYPITVGAGGVTPGSPAGNNDPGNNGSNSIFSTITSAGGAKGAGGGLTPAANISGGSGGGGGYASGQARGLGNSPPVSPPQGNNGGLGNAAAGTPNFAGGGGGGAGGNGADTVPTGGGNGGLGLASSITASPVTRAGGGGGGTYPPVPDNPGDAGPGGGGVGGRNGGSAATDATVNTGSGGGGSGEQTCNGGNGGSGIVIIRYKFQ